MKNQNIVNFMMFDTRPFDNAVNYFIPFCVKVIHLTNATFKSEHGVLHRHLVHIGRYPSGNTMAHWHVHKI